MEEKGCEVIEIKETGKMLVNLSKTVSCYIKKTAVCLWHLAS